MIANIDQKNQLPKELKSAFNDLQMLKHLRRAGITKGFGFFFAYLFQLLFCLIFEQKNWYRLLESRKSESLPEKDTVYRFLNHSKYKLQKEFQGRSYDLLISHTTIVFSRYILLPWQNRCSTDVRTLGGMFYELCDEVK